MTVTNKPSPYPTLSDNEGSGGGGGGSGIVVSVTAASGETFVSVDNFDIANPKILTTDALRAAAAKAGSAYQKPGTGIPRSDLASVVQTSLDKADRAYMKPPSGVPISDLSSGIQTSLGKADTAYQKDGNGIPRSDLVHDVQVSLDNADTALQEDDVVDNLTTADPDVPLSARQGVIVKGLVDGKVGLQSDTTQVIDSDVALAEGRGLYTTDSNGTEHTAWKHAEYSGGSQNEAGSMVDALCLNYNTLGWNGSPQSTGHRLPVNYKDTDSVNKADSLPLYNRDIVPIAEIVASLQLGGLKIGSFAAKSLVPSNPSSSLWLKYPSENDFFTVQADESYGGARTQYFVTAVDSVNDTMEIDFDGSFDVGALDILITDFSSSALVSSIPSSPEPCVIYWAANTPKAPDVGAGFGMIQMSDTSSYAILAVTIDGTYHGVATTSVDPVWGSEDGNWYEKPSSGIPKSDLASAVQVSLGKADTALQSFTETDPTVPSWAKAAMKPSYTASEVGAYAKPTSGIPKTDLTSTVQASLNNADSAYQKDSAGIPKTDLASGVQTSLNKADSALQSFMESDPTVPSWAKAASKPAYTALEVGAMYAPVMGTWVTPASASTTFYPIVSAFGYTVSLSKPAVGTLRMRIVNDEGGEFNTLRFTPYSTNTGNATMAIRTTNGGSSVEFESPSLSGLNLYYNVFAYKTDGTDTIRISMIVPLWANGGGTNIVMLVENISAG